jgi:hypothetical protein
MISHRCVRLEQQVLRPFLVVYLPKQAAAVDIAQFIAQVDKPMVFGRTRQSPSNIQSHATPAIPTLTTFVVTPKMNHEKYEERLAFVRSLLQQEFVLEVNP